MQGYVQIRKVVSKVQNSIRSGGMTAGDLAGLRRLQPGKILTEASFWKVLIRDVQPVYEEIGEKGLSYLKHDENRWAAILKALAQLEGLNVSFKDQEDTAAEEPNKPGFYSVGSVLARGGYSEMRLSRLLKTDGERLYSEIGAVVQYLKSKGESVDVVDFARLLLAYPNDLEKVKRGIARDYYRNLNT